MTSIDKHRIRQRVSYIYDTSQGSQGTSKSIKEYTQTLEKAVGTHTERMGSAADFNSEVGSI